MYVVVMGISDDCLLVSTEEVYSVVLVIPVGGLGDAIDVRSNVFDEVIFIVAWVINKLDEEIVDSIDGGFIGIVVGSLVVFTSFGIQVDGSVDVIGFGVSGFVDPINVGYFGDVFYLLLWVSGELKKWIG